MARIGQGIEPQEYGAPGQLRDLQTDGVTFFERG